MFRNMFLIKLWSTSPMRSHSNPGLRWIALFWFELVTLSTFMETHRSARSQASARTVWRDYFSRHYTMRIEVNTARIHWLRAGRSGDRIPVEARFSAAVQTGSGAHPASCTMGTGSFPGVKSGRGVTLTLHPLLVPWSWKSRAIPLLPLWAVRHVQSLSVCTRVLSTARSLDGETLTLRWLMSYIYGAPILEVSRSHTTTQHSR